MTAPDPVDVRLLTAVAESGRAAVPELAGRLGMDVRDVAARLAALSTTGLPMVVGVECDPVGIRNAVAAAHAWAAQASGGYQVSGPHAVPNPPSGGHQVHGGLSGGHTGGHPGQAPQQPFVPAPPASFAPPQQPQAAPPQHGPPQAANPWGPPGSAAWARGDQPAGQSGPQQAPRPQAGAADALTAKTPAPGQGQPVAARTGKVGSKLDVDGLEGERITIQLVEVVDPADFLFTAAGYQLQEGERSVVVHTELTNRSPMPFTSLPDLYLVLVAADGSTVGKAPVSLSSRPPHRIGVPPGETAGGHTVYVLPDETELAAVRWSPRPGDEQRTLLWDITDL
ncbi:AsnC family protein [Saccharopolyspora sp. MS10]|uniref:AsnC family protein n=1 Tax=Saccharopolyspora sp. MS10 TaxID=3385973 RepID=UPI0039A3CAE9